jgi:hypothetical protein
MTTLIDKTAGPEGELQAEVTEPTRFDRRPLNTVQEVVRVHRLELCDRDGQVRGELACSREGDPSVTLWSADNEACVELSIVEHCSEVPGEPNGLPFLSCMVNGTVRLQIGLERDGRPTVVMMDEDGRPVTEFGAPAPRR